MNPTVSLQVHLFLCICGPLKGFSCFQLHCMARLSLRFRSESFCIYAEFKAHCACTTVNVCVDDDINMDRV